MSTEGASATSSDTVVDPTSGGRLRPLTARSVLVSTLLGTDPPRLPVSFLVRTGALFGLAEGTVRTALSRMVSNGDVTTDGDGWYALTAELASRGVRQQQSRLARTREWSGRWSIAVVAPGSRPARERAALRRAMERSRLAELREGVWLRPDNLSEPVGPGSVVDERSVCHWFLGDPLLVGGRGDDDLAAELWDLDGWATVAAGLRRSMHDLIDRIEAGDPQSLAPGFVLSAAVLRHFLADPLLPRELTPRSWPGPALRADYERYDRAYRTLLRDWSGRPEPAGT